VHLAEITTAVASHGRAGGGEGRHRRLGSHLHGRGPWPPYGS
jgi:hypothetical protein